MKVELRRSGGFAAPALSRPIVLDTTSLGDQQSARVRRVVAAAREFLSDERAKEATSGVGADLIQYTVAISEDDSEPAPAGEGVRALTFSDPIPDPALGALVDTISELGEVRQP